MVEKRKIKQVNIEGIWGTKYTIIPNYKEKKTPFISNDEYKMYRCLEEIFKNTEIKISTQVALNQIVEVNTDRNKKEIEDKISRKSIDFVLFSAIRQKVLCCIELNDKSHEKEYRKKRDTFLKEVFEYTNIPLIFIESNTMYKQEEIKKIIKRKTDIEI